MKICEFSAWELSEKANEIARLAAKETGIFRSVTPAEHATLVLLRALETVNQAGLDGKKLSDLRLVTRSNAGCHPDDQKIEIHAKVTHRIRQQNQDAPLQTQ